MITALMRPCGGRLAAPTHRLLACATAMRCQQPSSWPPAGARSLASAATDAVIVCDTPDQYEAAVAAAGDKLVVSYFTASWCGPCKMVSMTIVQYQHPSL
jgi:thiol-disulfide isomerase/thioredoxin